MAKIAITTIPYWGHINVTLSLGYLLLRQGHEVVWVIPRAMQGLCLPEGGRLVLSNPENDPEVTEVMDLLDAAKSKAATEGGKFVLEDVLLPLGKLMYPGLSDFLNDYRPNLVIHDEHTYVGGICAAIHRIPYITTHAPPSGVYETAEENIRSWYFNTLREYQAYFGIPREPLVVRSKKLGLAFCPRDFGRPTDLMEGQVFVGPCLDVPRRYAETFDYGRITGNGKKNIMVSIGTLLEGEARRFFQYVIDDFKDSDYNVIVAADPELFDEWPDNFIVQKRVPHLDLLDHLDVVITHGGANTVCDCIGKAIPMVVVPMAIDQYYNAEQIAFYEMGVRLRYKRLRPLELRRCCDTLVDEDSVCRRNIRKFSEIYTRAGGAGRAARLVEQFIQNECG